MNIPVTQMLGTPFLLADYRSLTEKCREWARADQCVLLEFLNTHSATMRRHEPWFNDLTGLCDYFLPDGMPLVWVLNSKGAGLHDRVYGPTFMREVLATETGEFTHYLVGGSAECGAKLREVFGKLNPKAKIIGGFHGMCRADGTLEGEAEQRITAEINQLSPDFIWVGLGTPKQQAWARKHKPLFKRGIILGVGFAFDANAGTKPDAPLWMQKRGLGWIHRLASEPRRLGPRYLKYNSLFLFYLLRDWLRRKPSAAKGSG